MPVGPQPVDLDKGTGQLLTFPRRGRFAREQPHRDILDPHRLARPQRQVADNPVALVEQPQHGHALGHWGDPGLLGGSARHVDCDGLVLRFASLVREVATARGQQQGKRKDGGGTGHAYSGFHAS